MKFTKLELLKDGFIGLCTTFSGIAVTETTNVPLHAFFGSVISISGFALILLTVAAVQHNITKDKGNR